VDITDHRDAVQAKIDTHFGKTLGFPDQFDRRDEPIITAHRSQAKIEDAWRQMKDPHFVFRRPLLDWTRHKVRVHAAHGACALLLSALLPREVGRAERGANPALRHAAGPLAQIQGGPRPAPRRATPTHRPGQHPTHPS
jgi:hypothetical protein